MMDKGFLSRLRNARSKNDGFSLIDTVITVALTTIISGILVYAVVAMNSIQKDTLTNANASISASGLINFFGDEVERSKAHEIDEEHGTLKLRSSKDKCVTYRYNPEELTLAKTVEDSNGVFERHGIIAEDLTSVSFTEINKGVSITLEPKVGPTSTITAETKVLQGTSGGCW